MSTDAAMALVQSTWLRQARTEYMAASLVAEMTHWLIALGVRPDVLVAATTVVKDEIRHATICRELYLHAGGASTAVELTSKQLQHADDTDAPLHLRAITAVGELACEESVALGVFRLRLDGATDPMAREVCRVILRDEATHRLFALDALDALVELMGQETVRAWVRPRLAWWLRTYLGAEIRPDEPQVPARALAFGVIDRGPHWLAMQQTVATDVLPQLQRRGLLEADATSASLRVELAALRAARVERSKRPPRTA